jgi:hypothetical protein
MSGADKAGSQEEYLDKSAAAFGKESQARELDDDTQEQVLNGTPYEDEEGRSGESSEGAVVDHAAFNGIEKAMREQDKLRETQKVGSPPASESPYGDETGGRSE